VDVWLALLIVTLFLLLVTGILGLLAVNRIQKGAPPVPEQAIEEAKLTSAALKSDGRAVDQALRR
jgi:Putative Actinobacterial Holin-X, holin superfamily III